MLTPKQKIAVAYGGTALVAQALLTTRLFVQNFKMSNEGRAMVDVLNKHDAILDDIDRQRLIKAGLKYAS